MAENRDGENLLTKGCSTSTQPSHGARLRNAACRAEMEQQGSRLQDRTKLTNPARVRIIQTETLGAGSGSWGARVPEPGGQGPGAGGQFGETRLTFQREAGGAV